MGDSMNITDILGQTASVAVAVERITEILKPAYLIVKKRALKKEQSECTKVEKNTLILLLSIFICIIMHIKIDIPGITESGSIQEILAGLVSSFGSSILHTLVTILSGVKNTIESRTERIRKNE